MQGEGSASVDFGGTWPTVYAHKDCSSLKNDWAKYEATFVSPETADNGRVQINVKGNGTVWIDVVNIHDNGVLPKASFTSYKFPAHK